MLTKALKIAGTRFFKIAVIYNVLYILIVVVHSILESGGNLRTIWLPAGLSFAAIIIFGKRILPAILAASFLSNLSVYNSIPALSFIAAFSGFVFLVISVPVTAWAGLYLLDRYKIQTDFQKTVRFSFIFILIAALISLINPFIQIIFNLIPLSTVYGAAEQFFKIWLGELTGILIITSLTISIYKNKKIDIPLAQVAEVISIFILTIIFTQLLFGGWIKQELSHAIPFLIIPVLLWVSFRFGIRETIVCALIISLFSMGGYLNASGPFIRLDGSISVLGQQIYLAVITIVALILSVSVQERKQTMKELTDISESLEKRVIKRTDELATLNKELLIEVNNRKKAEAELKESEERNTALLSSLPDLIFLHDREGRFLDYRSPDLVEVFFDPTDIIGKKMEDVLPPRVAVQLKKVFYQTLELGETQSVEYSVNMNNSEKFYEARFSLCGENRIMSVLRDITDRVKAEDQRRQLEGQVRHSQKLESLGVLAGGIAHDFNNLLTAIMGNTGLALMNLSTKLKAKKNLENIEKASLRAADLCQQLLAYSGKGKFIVDAININEMVNEMSKLLEVSISKKVILEYKFSEKKLFFDADPTQIRQIIMNLITNASEAIGDNTGKVTIVTGIEKCSARYLKSTYFDDGLLAGDYVFLEVTDNGVGMNAETISKIFDPFFTTKFTGRGLGLAAVVGIVRSHKGAITIESKMKKGTHFKIYFPVSHSLTQKEDTIKETDIDWHGKGTILVVDDDEAIRFLGKATLEKVGLQVITAVDGRDAVNIFKKKQDEINLVLMDMTMPRLSGEEAFKKLQEINPAVKVVLSSGYSEQEATRKFSKSGLMGFLQKPYRPSDLIAKVKSIIDV